ncbi:MAG: hypothetical protein RLZZ299_2533 [Pseudomonadota bacterium]
MALRWNDAERTLDLAVGDLVAVRDSSLHRAALRARARLAAGVALHAAVEAERGADWASEVVLRHTLVIDGWTVTVHGRVDGVVETPDGVLLEEVKSTLLAEPALRAAASFHAWELQLSLYVWLARRERWDAPRGILRIVSLVDGAQRFVPVLEPEGLEDGVLAGLGDWIEGRERLIAWREVRRAALVAFAHEAWRADQEQAAADVERALRDGRHVLLEAPTGSGKTAVVLLAALRAAVATERRVFWATARGTQSEVVERTVAAMAARGTRLRTVTLRSRARSCLQSVVDCRPEACTYADGHFSRAPGALRTLPEQATFQDVRAVSRGVRVCPHALALQRAEEADLVIGDLNHVFDPDVRAFAQDDGWILVVDEAHALPARALDMASPVLERGLWAAAGSALPDDPRAEALHAFAADVCEAFDDCALLADAWTPEGAWVEPSLAVWDTLAERADALGWVHAALVQPDGAPRESDPWVEAVRALARFVDGLRRGGDGVGTWWTAARMQVVAHDPARLLGPCFAAVHASVSVSATLAPQWAWRARAGLDAARVEEVSMSDGFPPSHRLVLAVPGISTAYRHRERDRARLVDAVRQCVDAVPGGVIVFFSSFEALSDVLGACDWPGRRVLRQSPEMDEAAREALLETVRDSAGARAPWVLGAVLGGVFAEGIDLPSGAARATIVVGPSLPPPSAVLRARQDWWEDRHGDGFRHVSVQPGMTRVVQAAGRVVRSESDRGAVVLLCQRFLQHDFRAFLPSSWEVESASRPWERLRRYFAEG